MPGSERVDQLLHHLRDLTTQLAAWVEGEQDMPIARAEVLYRQRAEVLKQLEQLVFHSGERWTIAQIKVWKEQVDIIQDIDRKIVDKLKEKLETAKTELLMRQKQKQVLRYQRRGIQ